MVAISTNFQRKCSITQAYIRLGIWNYAVSIPWTWVNINKKDAHA